MLKGGGRVRDVDLIGKHERRPGGFLVPYYDGNRQLRGITKQVAQAIHLLADFTR